MAQCRVRFLDQLAKQPTATARETVAAEKAWSGYHQMPIRLSVPHARKETEHQ